MGDGLNNAEKFNSFYSNITNQGKLWTPEGTDGTAEEMKVPNLLAIPNALVELLRPLGASLTPTTSSQLWTQSLKTRN